MKIGIIGIGVVGNALYCSFKNKGVHNLVAYDKFKNIGSIDNTFDSDIIFLCLPTPYDELLKSYNKVAIYEICRELSENNYNNLVVLKSTVEPETTKKLSELYNLKMCHNPEFLSARTAVEDFDNQTHIVIGRGKYCDEYSYDLLYSFYKKYYPRAEISCCTSSESELMKLGVNNFYAVKIQFFNELFALSHKIDHTDYEVVRGLMLKNGWIHPMHTIVPGTDGQLSYGGMCFPKDTNALYHYMKSVDSPHKVISATIAEHNEMRND